MSTVSLQLDSLIELIIDNHHLLDCEVICDDKGKEIIHFKKFQLITVKDSQIYVINKDIFTIENKEDQDEIEFIANIMKRELTADEDIFFEDGDIIQINNCAIINFQIYDICLVSIPFTVMCGYIKYLKYFISTETETETLFIKQIIIDSYLYTNNPEKNLVSRAEFSIQKQVLNELKEKLKQLNSIINVLTTEFSDNEDNKQRQTKKLFLKKDCPICAEPFYKLYDSIVTLGCGHTLCMSCMNKLKDCKCPICRVLFVNGNIGKNIDLCEEIENEECVVKYKKLCSSTKAKVHIRDKIDIITTIVHYKSQFINDTNDKLIKSKFLEYYKCSIDYKIDDITDKLQPKISDFMIKLPKS